MNIFYMYVCMCCKCVYIVCICVICVDVWYVVSVCVVCGEWCFVRVVLGARGWWSFCESEYGLGIYSRTYVKCWCACSVYMVCIMIPLNNWLHRIRCVFGVCLYALYLLSLNRLFLCFFVLLCAGCSGLEVTYMLFWPLPLCLPTFFYTIWDHAVDWSDDWSDRSDRWDRWDRSDRWDWWVWWLGWVRCWWDFLSVRLFWGCVWSDMVYTKHI